MLSTQPPDVYVDPTSTVQSEVHSELKCATIIMGHGCDDDPSTDWMMLDDKCDPRVTGKLSTTSLDGSRSRIRNGVCLAHHMADWILPHRLGGIQVNGGRLRFGQNPV